MKRSTLSLLLLLMLAIRPAAALESEGKVPDHDLSVAQMLHKGMISFGYPEAMRDMLRLFALRNSEKAAKKNRDYLVKEKWHPDLVEGFDQAVAWVRTLRQDPRRAYELWKVYREKGKKQPFPSLADALLILAVDSGLAEARFEWARSYLDDDGFGYPLRELADADYLPAQLEFVRRYREGDDLEKDNAKAFYWLSRAIRKGAKVMERHRLLSESLTEEEHRRVESWFKWNVPPSP
ncbi:MAG: hypothetical protein QGI13_05190 [Rhodospirillales bacterium]|jgi:TPR repeat protein|nr:hypothetical protein [Rhodospirillales bacterium]